MNWRPFRYSPPDPGQAIVVCKLTASGWELGYLPTTRDIEHNWEFWMPFSPPPVADACLRAWEEIQKQPNSSSYQWFSFKAGWEARQQEGEID